VSARGCDRDRALGHLLAADVSEVDMLLRELLQPLIDAGRRRLNNVHVWSRLMAGRPVSGPPGRSIVELASAFDEAAAALASVARSVDERGAWDDLFLDVLDNPPAKKSFGGGIAHVVTHSMHHRAQILYMLRRLGLQELPEGDVLSSEQQAVT
jgi:uncharacterized damage-inducible protein DinB